MAGLFLMACTAKQPLDLGVSNGALTPCPDKPNCVSSDAKDTKHGVQPYSLTIDADLAWPIIKTAVLKLPRTKIVTETNDYLHVEVRSAVFRFVDDLELHLRPSLAQVAVRSASRLGHSDFGVNRSRIEQLRFNLIEAGVLK